MSDNSPAGPASSPPTEPARQGVSRAVGLGISAATALVVFVAGSVLFPQSKATEQPVAVVAPPPPPPPPPPPVIREAGAPADASAPEAGLAEVGTEKPVRIAAAEPEAGEAASESDAETPPKKKKGRKDKDKDKDREKGKEGAANEAGASKKDNAVLPPSDGTATPPSEADCALDEKDMAREAWRRNWPAVCPIPSTGKAFILIPIKGSIEGEAHELRRKPKREARVTLPAGSESQLTMKQYKVRKLGFKDLRVSNTESGAKLRVKLEPGAGDPVFEIKDGYAKITVATPTKD